MLVPQSKEELSSERFIVNPEYPQYKISNWGRVYSEYRNRYLTPLEVVKKENGDIYYGYSLTRNGVKKIKLVHAIVYEAFTGCSAPTLHDNEVLMHINDNTADNRLANIRLGSRSENRSTERAVENYLSNFRARDEFCGRRGFPVLQIDNDGNIVNEFNSCSEAGRYIAAKFGNNPKTVAANISVKCKNIKKKAYGYRWMRK